MLERVSDDKRSPGPHDLSAETELVRNAGSRRADAYFGGIGLGAGCDEIDDRNRRGAPSSQSGHDCVQIGIAGMAGQVQRCNRPQPIGVKEGAA
jgi:hypothetical protein